MPRSFRSMSLRMSFVAAARTSFITSLAKLSRGMLRPFFVSRMLIALSLSVARVVALAVLRAGLAVPPLDDELRVLLLRELPAPIDHLLLRVAHRARAAVTRL